MTNPIKPRPFDTVSLHELLNGVTAIEWIVDRLIPPGASGALIGDGGIGKSWLTLELILAVASGRPWLNHFQTRQGPVLVVDEENAVILLRRRLDRLIRGHGLDPTQLSPIHFVIGSSLSLTPILKNGQLLASDTFLRLTDTVAGLKPSLITFDSLTRVHTSNENSSSEMSGVFRYVKQLIDEYRCSTWFTHHTNKRGGYRGSTDIRNFVDYAIIVEKVGDVLRMEHNKSRWDELVPPFTVNWNSNTSEGSLTLTYLGEASQTKNGKLRPWEFVRSALLEHKTLSRQELITLAKESGISVSAMDKAVAFGMNKQPPLLKKERDGRQVHYRLTRRK